jgi:hypothetical protein
MRMRKGGKVPEEDDRTSSIKLNYVGTIPPEIGIE